jgi:hypothetical protein
MFAAHRAVQTGSGATSDGCDRTIRAADGRTASGVGATRATMTYTRRILLP